jgi:hypothetical protein
LVGDISAKVITEDFLKPKIEDESLYEMSDDRVVNFASSKMPTAKSTMFPHHNIHKFTWPSPDGKTHNKIDHFSLIGDGIQTYLMSSCSRQQFVILTTVW